MHACMWKIETWGSSFTQSCSLSSLLSCFFYKLDWLVVNKSYNKKIILFFPIATTCQRYRTRVYSPVWARQISRDHTHCTCGWSSTAKLWCSCTTTTWHPKIKPAKRLKQGRSNAAVLARAKKRKKKRMAAKKESCSGTLTLLSGCRSSRS